MSDTHNKISREFTVTEVAEYLGISRPTLYAMLNDGRLGGLHLAAIYDYAYQQGIKDREEEIIKMIKS
jgi:DNA-directed RNA polymerase specialized sigma subunit